MNTQNNTEKQAKEYKPLGTQDAGVQLQTPASQA